MSSRPPDPSPRTSSGSPTNTPATAINIGVLAHVDAGKTSLTERLLHDSGATARLGSVDSGDTQTDTGEVERRRGITIRAAVAAFRLDAHTQVNLLDTPGHPDFVAEVERALAVLDGAVLVVSAVEGVQARTRVLARTLRRLRLPTVLFVNKIDRVGARSTGLLADLRRLLTPDLVALSGVEHLGLADARAVPRAAAAIDDDLAVLLAEHDDTLLARYVDGPPPGRDVLRAALRAQVADGQVSPVLFGSAITGAGCDGLRAAIAEFLRPPPPPPGDQPVGVVFAVDRGPRGDKVVHLRLFAGRVRPRQIVDLHRRGSGGATRHHRARVSGLQVIVPPGDPAPGELVAGGIARVHGLRTARIGDRIGDADGHRPSVNFAPPVLAAAVRPVDPRRAGALHAALTRLADEDPLIRTRVEAVGSTVLLHGAVQREVLAERLAVEFGVPAVFDRLRPTYLERLRGRGEGEHVYLPRGPNRFWQTLGVRVEPAGRGRGNRVVLGVEPGLVARGSRQAITDALLAGLEQGRYGWEIVDCTVTVVRLDQETPLTTAADFRGLAPLVLARALDAAGTVVHEPGLHVDLDIPQDALSAVLADLSRRGADLGVPQPTGGGWSVPAEIAAARLDEVAAALPGLSRGEGVLTPSGGADRPVTGPAPRRVRTDGDPYDQDGYLRFLSARTVAGALTRNGR